MGMLEMATQQQIPASEIAKRASAAITRVVLTIVLYVLVSAAVQYLMVVLLPEYGIVVVEYVVYAQLLLALLFGYLIVNGIAVFFYWTARAKYDHPTAVAVRNVVRIIGIGAMVAAIAGGVAGGAAGVALGGFLGIVVGFASQQVLGQAVAGLFLLLARPFRVGDAVVVAGEDGVVEDVGTLFTTVTKADGVKVLIPNNAIIGSKIYLKPKM
jgi:small-conductance mechanosensitive channel